MLWVLNRLLPKKKIWFFNLIFSLYSLNLLELHAHVLSQNIWTVWSGWLAHDTDPEDRLSS